MTGLAEQYDYKKLIRFTLPTIAMMIFTSIYGVVDGLFVSNIVGSMAFASVNLIMPAIMILGSVGFMIGTGGSALVSKTMGEGDQKKANEYFSMMIWFLIISGIILSVLGFIFIEPVAKLLGADAGTMENCIIYGKTIMAALTFFFLQNAFQSFLVVAEKPVMGLKISVISGCTNMVLDFVFIYIFKMGVFGAAFATAISQAVGAIIPIIYFACKKDEGLKLVRPKYYGNALLKACTNGSSEMLTNVSMSLVNMLYNFQLMNVIGHGGVVAYGIIMYVGFIFFGIYMGYSVGVAPIISYHYGAENRDELKSLFKKSIKMIAIATIVLTLAAEALAGVLAGIFVHYDAQLMKLTAHAIRIFSLSYIVSGFSIFSSSFFTALNNGFVSALISFLRTVVFQVSFILLMPIILGADGIWLAIVFAELLTFAVCVICIMANRKKYGYM